MRFSKNIAIELRIYYIKKTFNFVSVRLGAGLDAPESRMRGFVVVASPLSPPGDECGAWGNYKLPWDNVKSHETCPHIIVNTEYTEKEVVRFVWQTPACGCVKIR